MTSKFQKFGLRRDRNLSDISDKDTALGNLLDGLALDANTGFVPEDIRVINGLSATDITTDDFAELLNTKRTYTPANSSVQELLVPLVTIRDNIENFKVVTENPPSTAGGPGPDTYFFSSDLIASANTIKTLGESGALTVDDIFVANTGDPGVFGPLDFWQNGVFVLNDNIYTEIRDTFGGIMWEGYVSALNDFSVFGSGFFHIEQDLFGDDNWTTIASFYSPTRTITIESIEGDGSQSTIYLGEDAKYALIGDFITSNTAQDIRVSDLNSTAGFIVTTQDITGSYANGDTLELFYDFSIAENFQTDYFTSFRTSEFDRIKTRIAVWWPDPDEYDDISVNFYTSKEITFNSTGTGANGRTTPFSAFYKTPANNNPAEFSYRFFLQNRVSELNNRSNSPIETDQTLVIDYEPNLLLEDNLRTTASDGVIEMQARGRGLLEVVPATSPNFSNFIVGDWIVFEYENTFYSTQIIEKSSVDRVFIDKDIFGVLDANTIIEGVAFKNLGLVGLYMTTDGSTLVPLEGLSHEVTEVKANNLAGSVEFGSDTADFSPINTNMLRITSASANSAANTVDITVTDFQGAETLAFATRSIVGVYAHTGLQDLSSEADCVGVYGVEVAAESTSGANTISLVSTDDITTGDFLQYSDVVPVSTVVTSVNSTAIGISNTLTGTIPTNSTLILIDQSAGDPGAVDKSFCVLPLNTAPPFISTTTGLSTSNTYPNLEVNGLTFQNLRIKFTDANSDIVATANTDTTYSRTLALGTPEGTYKFLIK
jgi:hypothetical protein